MSGELRKVCWQFMGQHICLETPRWSKRHPPTQIITVADQRCQIRVRRRMEWFHFLSPFDSSRLLNTKLGIRFSGYSSYNNLKTPFSVSPCTTSLFFFFFHCFSFSNGDNPACIVLQLPAVSPIHLQMLILSCSAPKGRGVFKQRERIPVQQQILHQILPNGIAQDSYTIPA